MRRITWILLLSLFVSLLSADEGADNFAKEGWEHFKINEYQKAIMSFNEALDLDESNAAAHLGKIYYYNLMNKKDKALSQYIELCKNNEKDINEYVEYFRLLGSITGKNKDLLKFYKRLLKYDDLNYTNRLKIMDRLAGYYKRTSKLDNAERIIAEMNPLKKWKLIGPFDNILGAGFDEEYTPEQRLEVYEETPGKNDIPVNWFDSTNNPYWAWTDLTDMFSYSDAVFYANNFVYVPDNREVIIHYGSSGMTTLYLNDAAIASETEEEKNCDLDQFVIKTWLKQGWNRILVKIGYSENSRCNFFLNITDTENEEIDDMEISLEPQDYNTGNDIPYELLKNPYIDSIGDKILDNPEDILNYLKLVTLYLNVDDKDTAEKYLEEAENIAPDCSLIQQHLSILYFSNDKAEEARTIIENLFKTDENIPYPIRYQISKELDNENYDKVKEYIFKFEDVSGKNEEWYEMSIELNIGLEQIENYLSLLEEALENFPQNETFVNQKLRIYIEQKKLYDAYKLYEDYTKQHYNSGNLYVMALLALENQNFVAFDKYFRKLFEYNPASSYNRYLYANLMYSSFQNYAETMVKLNKAIEINPTAGHLYKLYGDAYKAMKGITKFAELPLSEAKHLRRYYQLALKYDPLNYDVRRQLRELDGEKSVFSLFDEFDYKALMSEEINADNYPDKHSVYVKDCKNVIVYENGGFESETYTLIKVLKDNGCEAFQEMQFSANYYEEKIVEEAKVIKPDGSEIEAEINNGVVVFKKLEPNDYIYYKLKTESYLRGNFKNHFFNSFTFNSTIPVIESNYVLLIPKDKKFEYLAKNFELEPSFTDAGNFYRYTWQESDIPAIEVEYSMPGVYLCSERIELSTVENWEFIVDWYLDLAKNRAKVSANIEKTVAQLVKDKGELSDLEKIQLVYEFITEEINYSHVSFRQSRHIPQKAKRVLSTGIGDCKDVTCLSISMLEELGLKAYYLLINTENKNPGMEYLPSVNIFNHVITAVDMGDSLFYMDLTAKNYPFGTIPETDLNSFCLLIKEGENTPFILEAEEIYPNAINYESDIVIKMNNQSHSEVSIEWCGLNAGMIRSVFRDLSEKETLKTVKESLADKAINVKLESAEFDSLDSLSPKVIQRYSFQNDESFLDTGSYKILKPQWFSDFSTSSALSYSERKYPIETWIEKRNYSEKLNIHIENQNLKLVELPEEINLTSKFADYTQKFSQVDGKIIAEKSYEVKQTWVSKEDYQEFKEFYNNLILADKRQLLFQQ